MKNQTSLRNFSEHLRRSLLASVLINDNYTYIHTYIHQDSVWKLWASTKGELYYKLIGLRENASSQFSETL